ncbi:S8 family serine peptidase [Shewanella benthica]|uniref:S8 family serine peptidase n=1 Tax=Shewanella benthica TaxID=43661 RepID=UPI00187AF4F4|nr:S8 family serine peptidase [Shewanella benthica]MBE7213932.1 S8 family serine peptidase [Shewanella benthica]MCL1061838.1 S8 family serine peptidase [Shewanella benthica]
MSKSFSSLGTIVASSLYFSASLYSATSIANELDRTSSNHIGQDLAIAASLDTNTPVLIPLDTLQSNPNYSALAKQKLYRGPYQGGVAIGAPTVVTTDKIKRCNGKSCVEGEFLVKFAPQQYQAFATSQVTHLNNDNGVSAQTVQAAKSRDAGLGSLLINGVELVPLFKQKSVSSKQRVSSLISPQLTKARAEASRWYRVNLTDASQHKQTMQQLASRPDVEYVEELKIRTITDIPSEQALNNDPDINKQWHLDSTNTPAAWQWLADNDLSQYGDRNVVVAVIDSGVDYNHPDLALNMWINQGEIADNGIDDDGNGFIDDVYGANVLGSTYDHHGDPMDDHGHGTHVAGIIAAKKDNGHGGVGIAPNVQIMAIKASQYSGILTSADIAEALYYAAENGADIINMSFGGTGYSHAEEDALAVAFASSVLIASAGNSGKSNDGFCSPIVERSYPAAYPWVLGVMAESPTPNKYGDYLAGFSNYDCVAKDSVEYEVMAPGVDIYSTLPNEGYAAWDGTSMAAPVVAGIAALTRTRFNDKSVYSSRFIMGQLGATGVIKQGKTYDETKPAISYHSIDALEALTNTPKPALNYLEHYLWDGANELQSYQGEGNGDGVVDAGETIDLAVIVRNQWGQSDGTVVTLSAEVDGAMGVDPHVTWLNDSVNYDSVGTFGNDDNGLMYDTDGVVVGVEQPFTFKVADNTPNNHIINIKVRFSSDNGLDPQDGNQYTSESEFQLLVNRGVTLPSILDSDAPGSEGGLLDIDGVVDGVITLGNQALYIIDKPVLIAKDTTVKMGPGVQVQFWGSQPDDAYAQFRNSYLQVEGRLLAEGSVEAPFSFMPSSLFPDRMVVLLTRDAQQVDLKYGTIANLYNGYRDSNGINKCNDDSCSISITAQFVELIRGIEGYELFVDKMSTGNWQTSPTNSLGGVDLRQGRLHALGGIYSWDESAVVNKETHLKIMLPTNYSGSLSDNSNVKNFEYGPSNSNEAVQSNNVFLGNVKRNAQGAHYPSLLASPAAANKKTSYQLSSPLTVSGKTYYVAKVNGWSLAQAEEFVSQLDSGDFATISTADEFTLLSDWLYETPALYNANVGYVRQDDDSYAWHNGEQPSYDFTENQLYWQNRTANPEVVVIDGKQPLLEYLSSKLENDALNGYLNCSSEFSDAVACVFEPEDPLTISWIQQRYNQFQQDRLSVLLKERLDNNDYADYASCHAAGDYSCQQADEAAWRIAFVEQNNQNCTTNNAYDCLYYAVDYSDWYDANFGKYNAEDAKTRVRADFSSSSYILEFDNDPGKAALEGILTQYIENDFQSDSAFRNNAILNRYWDANPDRWMQIQTFTKQGDPAYEDFSGNYWGTNSEFLIDQVILDYKDDFNLNKAKVTPRLIAAPQTAYPFVSDVKLLDAEGNPRPDGKFGAEAMIWEVSFNRDMAQDVQPNVWFGPDYPYTDFTVRGDWIDARTWRGNVHVSPVASDGYQYVRIQDAVTAENAWLKTGEDYARYRFLVNSSGLEALNLQASAGEGYIDLTWSQDDFETLYGYNLYRATSEEGNYTRVHQSLIESETHSYIDENVEPGQQYFYQFKVVSAVGESKGSNIASATPVDTIAPSVNHSPITNAGYGANVLIQADVTDNIAVASVNLHYRTMGQANYIATPMSNQQNSQYRASLPGSAMVSPGVEYYIEASDGTTFGYHGRSATPHSVLVNDAPVITRIQPTQGIAEGGTLVSITGHNFNAGAKVNFGNADCGQVNWISHYELQCTTAAHFPGAVDITITNSNEQSHRLAGGFTYTASDVTIGIGDNSVGIGSELIIPIRINNVNGLKAFELTVDFDADKLKLEHVAKAEMSNSWSLSYYKPTDGQVNIVAASSGSSANGDGSLINLTFTAISPTETFANVSMSAVSLNDGAISADKYAALIEIIQGFSISGQVTHWSDSSVIVNTSLIVDNGVATTINDELGHFSLTGIRAGAHTLRATHNLMPSANTITAFDASLMLQHISGSNSLQGYALRAADLNNDGNVTAMEVNTVLEHAAGLVSLPLTGSPSIWQFNPSERSYAVLKKDLTNQNFTGYLIGDASGNALNQANLNAIGDDAQWFNRQVIGDKRISLDLYVHKTDTLAIDLNVSFDAVLVSLVSIEAQDSVSNWSVISHSPTDGLVNIVLANDQALTQSGSVLRFEFVLLSAESTTLSANSLMLNESSIVVDDITLSYSESDSDNDGISDRLELLHGLNPFDSTDALADNDNDGLTNLEEILLGTDPNNRDSDGDGISDGDEQNSGSNPLDPRDKVANVFTIEAFVDVNQDGIDDWVTIKQEDNGHSVSIHDAATASKLFNYSVEHSLTNTEVRWLSDRNNDAIPELALFGLNTEFNRYQLLVRNGANGDSVGVWNWPNVLDEVRFEVLDDLTQDSIEEFAVSGVHRINGTRQLIVKDGQSKAGYLTFKWPNLWDKPQFVTMTDMTGDSIPEVAMYGVHTRIGKGQLFIYDGALNTKVDVYNWNPLWSNTQLFKMDDLDSDGTDDWGQFGERKDDGRYQWLVKKGNDKRGVIRTFSWANLLESVKPLQVTDRTEDGVREVAIVGLSTSDNKVKLWINDGKAMNTRITNIAWPNNWNAYRVIEIGDMNNDGFTEFALYGFNQVNDNFQIIIKDGKTATEFGRYTWVGDWEDIQVAHADINNDGYLDVILIGQNQLDEQTRHLVIDATDLQTVISQSTIVH